MIIPSPRSKRKARIEIIPLIDIVFFLLATFVMISLSMVKSRGVDVRLPSAATATRQVKNNDYTAITLTKNGVVYFNKEKIALADLPIYLDKLKAKDKNPSIILNADENAAYGQAVMVLDEIRKKGISKVALETKQV